MKPNSAQWFGACEADQQRRQVGADDADPRQRLAVHQRGDDGGDADGAEQREGSRRADEAVDAMRGIDGAEQREGAGRRQYAGHIGVGDALDRHPETGAADEFGGRDQRNAEDAGHDEPYFRPENAGLDRIADEKEATERQRQAADPNRPARAKRGFDGRPRRFCRSRLGWGGAAR